VATVETPATLSCPICEAAVVPAQDWCREVGSWIFLDCPHCHRQSDVTFAPFWRSGHPNGEAAAPGKKPNPRSKET